MNGNYISHCVCLLFLLESTYGFLDASVEDRLTFVEGQLSELKQQLEVVQGCASDFCDIHWSSWSAWSKWTPCTGQCNQGYASREQTRSRSRLCIHKDQQANQQYCNGTNTETDKRPCNSVELYGTCFDVTAVENILKYCNKEGNGSFRSYFSLCCSCLNGDNTHNGSYGIAYNFFDELAQSTCTAILSKASHAAAIRRDCYSGHAQECSTICSKLGYSCFDELHVYHPAKHLQPNINHQTDEGIKGLSMYRYFSCTFGTGGCGPNYCCCMWP